ncbi:DegT/DnrJ/EryC1/StrS family aminotransferase [Rhodoplanes sp. TEM]|uniref:DegT/DnrJ/EryC1/StrS family aminotransferase n=1 Tax=Rhodoplanes tepidamans TaxID=200616 RepID=A0ABT5JB55_RHOTP|nr:MULTISPECIES: DegT/DnrJ/EryC1/StrS family aminotransferase [Rhodoplanes]MDC7786621.1 DegT/DnrJ/EryC1/StrS family aminotransferase [Rhodoplanes tepidamans]MDC7983032.1 DegT/DnrJ/EryC1/StrS family aminotransferase [Rhodoplanes sp. TEM]MDQ0356414.1 dTDP-4-amino-4,6-dideoxygalactose transaminase [Rhodoplanes tepidamans]
MTQHARLQPQPIPFIDVAAQRRALGTRVDDAVARVLAHCQFILGPEVQTLEKDLAAFCGASHAVTCASGTDALSLVLMAKGIGPGDAVICPSFTFCATAEVVALHRATPVFADIDEATYNISVESAAAAIAKAKSLGLTPRGIIPVDLFGLPADHDGIAALARAEGLFVLDDAAQSFGATYKGRRLGVDGLATATATSFFPAKPLGCYGDGGAIFTDDADLVATLKSLRVHGHGSDKYDNVRIGLTSRLDTVQAAVLVEKLKIFADEILARDAVAKRYAEGLADVVGVPVVPEGYSSVWAQYTIRIPAGTRDAFAAALRADGVPTAVYYPIPLHRQVAYKHFPTAGNGLPVSDKVAAEVISLPMHAYLDAPTQDRVIDSVRRAAKG